MGEEHELQRWRERVNGALFDSEGKNLGRLIQFLVISSLTILGLPS